MNLNTYQELAARTVKWMGNAEADLDHSAIGVMTELGELATVVKKHVVYGKELTPEMLANAAEEIGDVMWYVALQAGALGQALEQMAALVDSHNADEPINSPMSALNRSSVAMPILWGNAQIEVDTEMRSLAVWALTDAMRYLANWIGVDFDTILADNIAKLAKRYPDKYSDEAALARADKGGLDDRNS